MGPAEAGLSTKFRDSHNGWQKCVIELIVITLVNYSVLLCSWHFHSKSILMANSRGIAGFPWFLPAAALGLRAIRFMIKISLTMSVPSSENQISRPAHAVFQRSILPLVVCISGTRVKKIKLRGLIKMSSKRLQSSGVFKWSTRVWGFS